MINGCKTTAIVLARGKTRWPEVVTKNYGGNKGGNGNVMKGYAILNKFISSNSLREENKLSTLFFLLVN